MTKTNDRDYRTHKKYTKGVLRSTNDLTQLAHTEGRTKIYRVLSFGGGTQSAHLLEEHFKGYIDYDFIVFSDTGAEPEFIHQQVHWWKKRQKEVGNTTPFIITTHNSMKRGLEEMLMRYIFTDYHRFQLPLHFTTITETGEEKRAGMMPRQCTSDFKIVPVQQAVRKAIKHQLGLRPTQMMPKDIAIIMDIGFSYDEIHRVNGYIAHNSKYIFLAYPLIEKGMTTEDTLQYLQDHNLPNKRSRCYLCPFNCDKRDSGMEWEEIIKDEPLSFLKACFFDEELRKVQAGGTKRMQSIPYFHYSRRPLKEVYPTEYTQIAYQYQKELHQWNQEWMTFLDQKYGLLAKDLYKQSA